MVTPRDSHSHARPDEARVTHLSLDLSVDMAAHRIRGTATLDLEVAPGITGVVLDSRHLVIHAARDGNGAPLPFALEGDDPVRGSALSIELPGGTRRIALEYETTGGADALQWLEPAQTAGGRHPLLFTQGQPIFARTWIPIQDSPGIRFTYDAVVRVKEPLLALMSAERLPVTTPGEFRFRMEEPIPAYLLALVVGDLGVRELGPRSAVFAEPPLLEAAAHELVDVDAMITAAEALAGPYRWGRFDMVIMPPAFPYGGMENPRLVFASPTLIAGDRSLVTVFAHELAHAWAGNLVINATWDDFWLNEGTTVYLELRINEALYGTERAALLKAWGHREVTGFIRQLGTDSPDTRLRYSMDGRDPAEGVTPVPYLKGAAFFWTLEERVGRARLDAWLRSWFDRKAFRCVTTAEFVQDLRHNLLRGEPSPVDLDAWLEKPGLLPEAAPAPSRLLQDVESALERFVAGAPAESLGAGGWLPQQWRHFLGVLAEKKPTLQQVEALDSAFHLSNSGNAEVLAPWLRLEAMVQRGPALPRITAFLLNTGRTKYLRPLYAALLDSPWGRPVAREVFGRARIRYHALARRALERLFKASA